MATTENSQIIRWLKRIFSWQTIMAVVTLCGFVFTYMQFRHDRGGTLTAFYNGDVAYSDERQQMVVCVDDASADLSVAAFTPTFVNNSEYSIRDFMLQYQFEASGIDLEYSDFFTAYRTGPATTLRYKENTLYAFSGTEPPIAALRNIHNNSKVRTQVKATYDGASRPFVYTVDVAFYVIPKAAGQSFGEWKALCNNTILTHATADTFQAIYASGGDFASEPIISASALRQARQEAASVAQAAQQQPAQKPAQPAAKPAAKPVEPAKTTEKPAAQPEVKPAEKPAAQPEAKPAEKPVEKPAATSHAVINVTGCEIARLADSTVVATLSFDAMERDTAVCFAFCYRYDTNKRISYTIRHHSLKRGATQCSFAFDKKYNDLIYTGLATEDPQLADCIAQPAPNQFRNQADFPVGLYVDYGGGLDYSFGIEKGSYITIGIGNKDRHINRIHYFRLPQYDPRTTKWQRFKYTIDGGRNPWYRYLLLSAGLLLIFAILFVFICREEHDRPSAMLKTAIDELKASLTSWHRFWKEEGYENVLLALFFVVVPVVLLAVSILKFIAA